MSACALHQRHWKRERESGTQRERAVVLGFSVKSAALTFSDVSLIVCGRIWVRITLSVGNMKQLCTNNRYTAVWHWPWRPYCSKPMQIKNKQTTPPLTLLLSSMSKPLYRKLLINRQQHYVRTFFSPSKVVNGNILRPNPSLCLGPRLN